jgi:protein-tyrosine phosphatase
MPEVLFICTGNFYRSRFAEAAFNHEARRTGSRWRAFSRGLAIHLIDGDLSPYAAAALTERGISRDCTGPTRVALTEGDLERAALAIALYESEHRPLMEEHFPHWADRITYWHVGDLGECEPALALGEIARRAAALLTELDGSLQG